MFKHVSVLCFSFIEATAWIKLFLLQLTMTTTIINQHSAARFLKTMQRSSLKEVNWNNTHWKDCPYYQKRIILHIAHLNSIVLPVLLSTSD